MVVCTMESSTTMKYLVGVNTDGMMEKSMRENGSRIKCMDEEN